MVKTALALVAVVAFTLLIPDHLVPLAGALAVVVVIGVGAWVSLGRIGFVDLATGAAVGAGAAAGVAVSTLAGVPVIIAAPVALVVGAAVGLATGAVCGRTGRVLGSLASLALGVAVVGLLVTVVGTAGVHGIAHATGGPRGDLILAGVLAVIAVAIFAGRIDRATVLARAAVAARAPHVSASLGRRPTLDAATGGAIAGGVLGLGGLLGAGMSGSVVPDGYGLPLSAGLALAAVLGGGSAVGGAFGALVVLGLPAVAVGGVPALVGAAVGLAALAARPGGLVRRRTMLPSESSGRRPTPARKGLRLDVDRAPLPDGRTVSFSAEPGEVVALLGPNGSGKSTLIAMVSGDIPDDGRVAIGGAPPPPGAVRRSRLRVARSWQISPDLDAADALAVAGRDPAELRAAGWVRDVLGEAAADPAGADLTRVAARRAGLVLLDEPAAGLPTDRVIAFLRGLADGGATVVVAEHRREIAAACDRVVEIGSDRRQT